MLSWLWQMRVVLFQKGHSVRFLHHATENAVLRKYLYWEDFLKQKPKKVNVDLYRYIL